VTPTALAGSQKHIDLTNHATLRPPQTTSNQQAGGTDALRSSFRKIGATLVMESEKQRFSATVAPRKDKSGNEICVGAARLVDKKPVTPDSAGGITITDPVSATQVEALRTDKEILRSLRELEYSGCEPGDFHQMAWSAWSTKSPNNHRNSFRKTGATLVMKSEKQRFSAIVAPRKDKWGNNICVGAVRLVGKKPVTPDSAGSITTTDPFLAKQFEALRTDKEVLRSLRELEYSGCEPGDIHQVPWSAW
jgi:uncharacterized glyoxalase superfamily protein PhnB